MAQMFTLLFSTFFTSAIYSLKGNFNVQHITSLVYIQFSISNATNMLRSLFCGHILLKMQFHFQREIRETINLEKHLCILYLMLMIPTANRFLKMYYNPNGRLESKFNKSWILRVNNRRKQCTEQEPICQEFICMRVQFYCSQENFGFLGHCTQSLSILWIYLVMEFLFYDVYRIFLAHSAVFYEI